MKKFNLLSAATALALASLVAPTLADTANFSLTGPGVSAQGTLTYSSNPDGSAKITAITGLFSDTNAGLNSKPSILNATITGLVAINPVTPLPPTILAPDFSQYAIVNGVPSPPADFPSASLSYDNTFYPNGSPIVCTDYPASGGLLDVYGVAFSLSTGQVVDLWSNGNFPGAPASNSIYGLAVADPNFTYDYVSGITLIPEPASIALISLAALPLARRRKSTTAA